MRMARDDHNGSPQTPILAASGGVIGMLIGSKNGTHCWSGFGHAAGLLRSQNGVQQPAEPCGQPAPTKPGSTHMSPGSQTLMNSQGSLACPSSPEASGAQLKLSLTG